jgi:hypothetical protein
MTNQALFIADITTPFSAARFGLPRRPLRVGKVPFAQFEPMPSCLDMLIKLPGGALHLPAPWADSPALQSMLAQALVMEDQLLPSWRDTHYAYLTVDQRTVPAHKTHRNAGWHFDGMQGTRYLKKLPACHQYLCADALPTLFSSCAVDATGLDAQHDNWFEALGAQARHDPTCDPAPMDIIAMSAYQLHQSPRALTATRRTFVRLDISLKQQDRLGNSLNPLLPAPWPYVARALPEGLGRPIEDAGWT